MTLYIMAAIIVALLAAGYLLVRYEIVDPKDATAGGLIIAAAALIWQLVTGRPTEEPKSPEKPSAPGPIPTPPTRDVDEIIDLSGKQLSREPPNDIHERLRNEIERQRREYGD